MKLGNIFEDDCEKICEIAFPSATYAMLRNAVPAGQNIFAVGAARQTIINTVRASHARIKSPASFNAKGLNAPFI